jgi:AmiR/NasT family two-component response regulator
VLTGFDDERRGVEAVAAGAQDYLVKGQVDGLIRLLHAARRDGANASAVLREVIEQAETMNGGPLLDDVAAVLITRRPGE